jgi:hypothetical protein
MFLHHQFKFYASTDRRYLFSVFAEGIEAVFRFSIALLLKAEEELLNLEFEGILKFLQTKLFDYYKVLLELSPTDYCLADLNESLG